MKDRHDERIEKKGRGEKTGDGRAERRGEMKRR